MGVIISFVINFGLRIEICFSVIDILKNDISIIEIMCYFYVILFMKFFR